MDGEPQAGSYRPDPRILRIADWLADPVAPAGFPMHELRFRNTRWDRAVGLADWDDARFAAHFGRFEPLPGNLPQPLALRYHGHQFRTYNPELGDGRGFLFAQLRDAGGRLLDFGTKGSGQTPYSRFGDGRLTLKGAVREVLATEMLEALGVDTSRTFAVFETGESLIRGDEPSPTRSAVLTRLSHGHIRIGSFQRLAALTEHDHLAALVDYTLATYPGPPPPADAPAADVPAVRLLHQVVERLADMAAAYTVAGFVHGVLNTDNMNVAGESFDYGPWRFLPLWDAGFTAAYFDHAGLYAFGRQPEAIHWNCAQLAVALRPLAESAPLIAALDRYGPCYSAALARRICWRLGIAPAGEVEDLALMQAAGEAMAAARIAPDRFFFDARAGRLDRSGGPLAQVAGLLADRERVDDRHPYWADENPQSMLVDEVEAIWAAIDQRDDWQPFAAKVAAVRRMGEALAPPPALAAASGPAPAPAAASL